MCNMKHLTRTFSGTLLLIVLTGHLTPSTSVRLPNKLGMLSVIVLSEDGYERLQQLLTRISFRKRMLVTKRSLDPTDVNFLQEKQVPVMIAIKKYQSAQTFDNRRIPSSSSSLSTSSSSSSSSPAAADLEEEYSKYDPDYEDEQDGQSYADKKTSSYQSSYQRKDSSDDLEFSASKAYSRTYWDDKKKKK